IVLGRLQFLAPRVSAAAPRNLLEGIACGRTALDAVRCRCIQGRDDVRTCTLGGFVQALIARGAADQQQPSRPGRGRSRASPRPQCGSEAPGPISIGEAYEPLREAAGSWLRRACGFGGRGRELAALSDALDGLRQRLNRGAELTREMTSRCDRVCQAAVAIPV